MNTRAEFINTILDLNEDFNNLNDVDKEYISIALFQLWNHIKRKSMSYNQKHSGINLGEWL